MKLLLFFLLPLVSLAQSKWIYKDANVRVEVLYESTDSATSIERVKGIQIFRTADNKKIQQIDSTIEYSDAYLDSSSIFRLEDMNFDGINDIRLLEYVTMKGETSYFHWLYDWRSASFVENDTLNAIASPIFNAAKKTIHSWWSVGPYERGHAIYRWKGKSLECIVKEELVHNWQNNTVYKSTTRIVNGKTETSISDEEYPELHCTQQNCTLH